jgi:hypothetical protein
MATVLNNNYKEGEMRSAKAGVSQYKVYAGSLSSSSSARIAFHGIFISMNTFVYLFFALSASNGNSTIPIDKNLLMLANLTGCVMSILWEWIIINYRARSKRVLSILCGMEETLPYQPFSVEREKRKKSCPLPAPELFISPLFAGIHLVLLWGVFTGIFNLGVTSH